MEQFEVIEPPSPPSSSSSSTRKETLQIELQECGKSNKSPAGSGDSDESPGKERIEAIVPGARDDVASVAIEDDEESHSDVDDIITSTHYRQSASDNDNSLFKLVQFTLPGFCVITRVRFCVFVFLFLFLLFSILILICGHVDLVHKQEFMSSILDLNIKEITIQKLFVFNSILLFLCFSTGFFSFVFNNYRGFVVFGLTLLVTMVFTLVTVSVSFSAYSRMTMVLLNHTYFETMFEAKMDHYDWQDYNNKSSMFINQFQSEYSCCGGINGFHGWESRKPDNISYGAFPITCCPLELDISLNIPWCTYEQVENSMNCPESFFKHLIVLINRFKSANMLLVEALLTQLLSVAVFLYLILKIDKFMNQL